MADLAHTQRGSVADSAADQKELHRRQARQTKQQKVRTHFKRFRCWYMGLIILVAVLVIALPLM